MTETILHQFACMLRLNYLVVAVGGVDVDVDVDHQVVAVSLCLKG